MGLRSAAPLLREALAARRGPSGLHNLPRPAHGKCVSWNVLRDAGGRPDVRPLFNSHRSHQGGIASHEYAFANTSLVLLRSVVVAEDRPGSNIAPRPDFRVSQVGKMIGFGALAQP